MLSNEYSHYMKKLFLTLGLSCMVSFSMAQYVSYSIDNSTGALNNLSIKSDPNHMDWMLKTDGSQYKWVTAKYGWGLGYLTLNGKTEEWQTPVKNSKDLSSITYSASDIQISVVRKKTSDGFTEKYTFTNKGKNQIQLTNIGIYTPFNDNYPDANICMTNRCNAHIWTGENAAYVALVRMDGTGDGIGLMVTDGRISDYDVWERGMQKSYSNFRGVIALCPNDTTLAPGKSTGVSWKVFHHSGMSDF